MPNPQEMQSALREIMEANVNRMGGNLTELLTQEVASPKRSLVVFDIDGVLADVSHRLHHIKNPDGTMRADADWRGFFEACDRDVPMQAGRDLLRVLARTFDIWLVSGRSDIVLGKTVRWLNTHILPLSGSDEHLAVLLRAEGDHRPDHVFKSGVIRSLRQEHGPVAFVVDDSVSIVEAALVLGIPALHFRMPDKPAEAAR